MEERVGVDGIIQKYQKTCQLSDMEVTLDNFANHLFPASLKALLFLEWFYLCSEQNTRSKVFFYFKVAVKMHV